MKKIVIVLSFFLFISNTHAAPVEYTNNGFYLAPMRGSTWEISYTANYTTYTEVFRCDTEIVSSEGMVRLKCYEQSGDFWWLFYTEEKQEYLLVDKIGDGNQFELYQLKVRGDTASGNYSQVDMDTGIETIKYFSTGTKIAQAPFDSYVQADIDDAYSDGYADGYSTGYNDGLSAAFTAPAASSPISETVGASTTFEFSKVLPATWYFLWIEYTDGTSLKKWYKAEDLTGDTCKVTINDNGGGKWWVRTWNKYGYGPWSEGRSF